jgi:ribonuclease Z
LSERAGPSALVVHHSAGEEHPSLYLVDAGRWVTQRLAQAQVPWLDIEAVLFTHHHMDHDIGWPDLFMTGYNMGRREKWQVYGPPPTAAFCETQEQAFGYDRAIRLIPSFQTEGFWSTVTELETGGPVLEHKGMAISACCTGRPYGRRRASGTFRKQICRRSQPITRRRRTSARSPSEHT